MNVDETDNRGVYFGDQWTEFNGVEIPVALKLSNMLLERKVKDLNDVLDVASKKYIGRPAFVYSYNELPRFLMIAGWDTAGLPYPVESKYVAELYDVDWCNQAMRGIEHLCDMWNAIIDAKERELYSYGILELIPFDECREFETAFMEFQRDIDLEIVACYYNDGVPIGDLLA